MPFIPAPNIVQVEIRALMDGQHVENRIFVNVFHEPTVADLTLVANPISNVVLTNWVPLMPSTVVFTELFCRSMHVQNGPQATFPIPVGSGTGTNISPSLPNNVALCVSLRSNFAGRSARGRLYWLALTETDVTESRVSSTKVTAITTAVQALDTAIQGAGFDWQIVSFFTNNAPRVGGPVYFSVNGILIVDNVVDSQRRRLPGRGT